MEYINCFQITSLVLVTMIAIHYFSHKRLNNAENRNFVCFLVFSGVYVVLDMLSAVIAGGGSSEGCRGSALVLTLYYFISVMSYLLTGFSATFGSSPEDKRRNING